MPPPVLLACLGNRNIAYQGRYAEIYIREEEPEKYLVELPRGRDAINFREFTQWLWEHYEEEKQHITLEIINEAIANLQQDGSLASVVLFTTDQPHSRAKFQDTVFEGYIVQKLIEERYGLPVLLYPYSGNPTQEDEIVAQLKPQLLEVYQQFADSAYVYHDAGGTPQMKAAIKMLMGYQLPRGKFKVSYSNQRGEYADKQNYYQKRYQSLTIGREFVKQYNYEAAREVLKMIGKPAKVSKALSEYVKLASYRKNFMAHRISQIDYAHSSPLCVNYLSGTGNEDAIPGQEFTAQNRSEIFELASISQLYFQQESYPLAVATFYRLIEEICRLRVSKDYPVESRHQREAFMKREKSFVFLAYEHLAEKSSAAPPGLPFLAAYVSLVAQSPLQEAIKTIIPHISIINGTERGINHLRNNTLLAHGRNYVDKGMINNECPNFLQRDLPRFFELLGMPEKNIYDQMNEEIIQLFNQE